MWKDELILRLMVSYTEFRYSLTSLSKRNNRLNLSETSLHAYFLKSGSSSAGIEFTYIMQADFVLFMYSELNHSDDKWWPESLVYLDHVSPSFEIFARAVSTKKFEKVRILLEIKNKNDLQPLFDSYSEGTRKPPNWGCRPSYVNPEKLMNYEQMVTLE